MKSTCSAAILVVLGIMIGFSPTRSFAVGTPTSQEPTFKCKILTDEEISELFRRREISRQQAIANARLHREGEDQLTYQLRVALFGDGNYQEEKHEEVIRVTNWAAETIRNRLNSLSSEGKTFGQYRDELLESLSLQIKINSDQTIEVQRDPASALPGNYVLFSIGSPAGSDLNDIVNQSIFRGIEQGLEGFKDINSNTQLTPQIATQLKLVLINSYYRVLRPLLSECDESESLKLETLRIFEELLENCRG